MGPLNIGIEKATQKAKQFCAYQERNHDEVRQKLYTFGLYQDQVNAVLSQLIDENYLNEERYAIAFAGGRFRIKDWGRIKIKYELKKHQVSEYCIKQALLNISEEEYQQKIEKLATIKLKSLKGEKNEFIKKKKLQSYLMQKGYESYLINECLQKM